MGRPIARGWFRHGPGPWVGAAALVALALTFRPLIQGDGVGYFAYLHTVLVGHSLDFTHSYAAATAAQVNSDPGFLEAPTAAHHPADFFPIGPAVLALPLYLAALLAGGTGQSEYSGLLTGAFLLTSLLCGLFAVVLCWRLARQRVAVVAAVACTPFLFYLLYEPSYSHTFNAFAVTAFVFVWWRSRHRRSTLGWLGLGLLAGLMTLTRWQDGVLAAIALLPVGGRPRWRILLLVPGMLIALAPQLLVDQVVFGTWWPQRPAGQALDPGAGHQLQVLVSSWHGLFVWSPMTLMAAVGMLFIRDRWLRTACLYALVVQTLINGAAPDWSGGAAFGARRFIDLLPFWAFGLAALADRVPPALAWAATVISVAWNVLLIANTQYVMRTGEDPGYLGLVLGQLTALRYLPHLAQGVVVRGLVGWAVPQRSPGLAAALGWLGAEAVAVWLAVRFAAWRRRHRELEVVVLIDPGVDWDLAQARLPLTPYRVARGVLDRLVAALALVVSVPVLVAIAIAIRLDSPGPVLFRQVRGGYLGQPFTILKFRTMRADAPRYSQKVGEDDPKITRVGRVLRPTGLDELPQLWNVLRGDMSLIGPRPEQYALLAGYEPWQHERHLVRPGLTGWYQVHHRDGQSMRENVDKDLYYVRNQGPGLDAEIVLRTLSILVRGALRSGRAAPSAEVAPVLPVASQVSSAVRSPSRRPPVN
jgi:lipopolysaccharide/colanic/teichoic acid biosynthesis glycosyltransferase